MRRCTPTALSAALAFVVAAPAAQAADAASAAAPPKFNIMGPATCANWPKSGSITSASKAVPLNWALGFLSGSAADGKMALLDLIDPDQVDKGLTAYCQAHPTDTLPIAVRQMEMDLEARLPPPPPPAPTGPPMFVPPTGASAATASNAAKAPAKKRAAVRKARPAATK